MKGIGRFSDNLVVQFSVISFALSLTLAVVIATILGLMLEDIVDLLPQHNSAVLAHANTDDTSQIATSPLTDRISSVQRVGFAVVGAGFLVLYAGLVFVVSKGWVTIRGQREALESVNAVLETRVAERVKDLEHVNDQLQVQVKEREQAEGDLRVANERLEGTLADLKDSQEQVVHQARMQALGQMASGVAHDFNNALSPIVAYTDLMISVPETLDNKEEVTEYLQTMNTAAEDAAGVVKRLREFYRKPEATVNLEDIDLSQVVTQVIALTQPRWRDQAQSKGITIEIETDLQEVPTVAANESELREVLTNLVLNATDAMPEGGTLTLRTRRNAEQAILEVNDTGVGMSEEVRKRCMEPFFTTKGEQGTGLGLAMGYGII